MKIVDRGAEFLDEVEPGWAELIDPDTLNLSSGCDCVLGQLYRAEHPVMSEDALAFDYKVNELFDGDYDRAGRLGFIEWGNARYENMTAAWRRAISKRVSRAA